MKLLPRAKAFCHAIALSLPLALGTAGVGATIASADALLLIEADSGRVLQAENATYPWYPASVTKVMTAYVTLRAVKAGRLSLDTPLVVSANAMAQVPSKMGFKVGTVVTVDNALKMLMVKSANDIAVVLAEGVAGSVESFADEMNAHARRLGMTQTTYVNPNGLPADAQVTSARDQAMLVRTIYREMPEYDYYWNLPGIKFGRRTMRNYNRLIDLYPGADGMKTGFICASGFNLVASATRNNRRLIAVVFGAPSASVRTFKAAKLLEQGFSNNRLTWLMPTLGTVEQLVPIAAAPPNLREETCGKNRKRPAAENEEVEISGGSESGSPVNFLLSNMQSTVRVSDILASGNPQLPPVDVFVGATRPSPAALAAQESQLSGAKPRKTTATSKPAKPKTAATTAAGTKPAGAKPAAAKPATAKPSANNAATAKPVTGKPAAAKPETAKPAAAKPATAKPAAPKPAGTKPAAPKPAPSAGAPQSLTPSSLSAKPVPVPRAATQSAANPSAPSQR